VRFAALGSAQGDSLLSLKRVVGSPRLHISYRAQGNRLYLFSTIDNLLKGAASQAIENFNRLAGFAIETSLETMEGVL
jgi:N-acetyl-gamma-glutamyl-phosphate reductase